MEMNRVMQTERRIEAMRSSMKTAGVDAVIVPVREGLNWETCYYLTGFRGSSSVFYVTSNQAGLITDGRYLAQAAAQTRIPVIDQASAPMMDVLGEILSGIGGIGTIGFQADRVTCDLMGKIKEFGKSIVDVSPLFSRLRRKKDEGEIRDIRAAADLASSALLKTLSERENDITESSFAARLEYGIRMAGAEGGWGSHEFIVASGPRSALPHGIPTGKKIEPGEMVTVDFGSRFNGYISDITRSFCDGEPPEWAVEAHELLRGAQSAAIALLEPGRPARDVDMAARSVIEKAGFGDAFSHSLGHGIGLEVHEAPFLSFRSEDILAEGDVVTIEPGVYFPGKGGMRLEDDFYITAEGSECLTSRLPSAILRMGQRPK
jgi:Xaa-Pro aminopeptidase